MADQLRGIPTTLSTTIISTTQTVADTLSQTALSHFSSVVEEQQRLSSHVYDGDVKMERTDSTINGVVIGLLSSFGSAILIAIVFMIVYFFKYTAGGRILLDRIGRPGEYDDEQAYAREEAEALEEMDDLQRTEYLRAKGRHIDERLDIVIEANMFCSIHSSQPSRLVANRYLVITIPRHTRKGRICMGV